MTTVVVPRRDATGLRGRVWIVLDWCVRHPYLTVFLLSLAVRLVVGAGVSLATDGRLFGDDGTYTDMARAKAAGADDRWDDYTRQLFSDTATFAVPLWLVFEVTGASTFAGQVLVAVVGALAATALVRLAASVVRPPLALVAGLVMALMPSLVLWSSIVLKDDFVWLLVIVLSLVCVRLVEVQGWSTWAWLAAALAALVLIAHVRQHTFVVALYASAVFAVLVLGLVRRQLVPAAALLAIVVVLPAALGYGVAGVEYATSRGSLEYRRYTNAVDAQTAFIPQVDPRSRPSSGGVAGPTNPSSAGVEGDPAAPTPDVPGSGGDAGSQELDETYSTSGVSTNLRHLPKGLGVMLVEPLPWQDLSNSRVRIAFAESVVWYPLLVLGLIGAFYAARRREVLLVLPVAYGCGMLLVYALSEGNFGSAYRHRSEITWIVILLAAFGLQRLFERRRSDVA